MKIFPISFSATNHKLRWLLFLLLLACLNRDLWAASPAMVMKNITVKQLETYVAAARGKPDQEVARELSGMELSERLSAVRLARCQADLPGSRSKTALLALADRSAFLDPPVDEISTKDAPDFATQKQMMELAVDYVKNTMHRLPNLSATRVTTMFQQRSASQSHLRPVGRNSVVVSYRDGQEKVESRSVHRVSGLTTYGEFGTILDTALLDAARGNLKWSHWEQGTGGPEAVFRYSVKEQDSHYKVDGLPFAYEGEIAIAPSMGAILRIALRTDLDPANPLGIPDPQLRIANIAVQYGPVELGGRSYICPLRGVALSNESNLFGATGTGLIWLNDRVFENYHLLRSDSRVLPGFSDVH